MWPIHSSLIVFTCACRAWQVSRLEAQLHSLEQELPPRNVPARIESWEDLTFGIVPTNGHVKHTWSSTTNAWDAGQFVPEPYVNMHIHAGVLHYGMTLFEGCKAFRSKDGRVRVCNLDENSARMNNGAARLVMPSVPQKMFNDAVDWAVRNNAEYVPPYGTGGSMYIRPFLMGSGPILGLQPCPEFKFMVSVTPVGNYFGKGGVPGGHACVSTDYDRAAPHGTGDVKAGGNYAADLLPLKLAKDVCPRGVFVGSAERIAARDERSELCFHLAQPSGPLLSRESIGKESRQIPSHALY